MAHETLPADIVAAIEELEGLVRVQGHEFSRIHEADIQSARVVLRATILSHLRPPGEVKATLEPVSNPKPFSAASSFGLTGLAASLRERAV